ncbi:MAG: exodeoxyribonuclease III [Alphaproteobacteria bacterium]|nr:exodeoxyribonuclease III [Alphaproteobacteria bacterium]
MLKIATWNINSVRLRLALIKKLVTKEAPDVLCLQETKTPDDLFPAQALKEMGFAHQHFHGMKSYNGVAILSKKPLKDLQIKSWYGKQDCRHIFATLEDGPTIHCLYIPAGGDDPDPKINPKFAHKLAFLDEITSFWKSAQAPHHGQILVGDLNIAPLENDVWSHKQLLTVVSHTPIEVEKLKALAQANKWVDAVRHFVPEEEKLYSWWSYRAHDWQASNRGRRLDHIWITPDLKPRLSTQKILKEARGWPTPSDHVPVMVMLK